jgi:hypothetical protein
MFLLYLDDAGSVAAAHQRHFVLAGICLFERQMHFLNRELERLAASIYAEEPRALELHASHMLAGKGFWRKLPLKDRRRHIRHGLAAARALKGPWAPFGAVVDKAAASPEDAIEHAFEHICHRFDRFLQREFRRGNKQRGLIVLDRSTRETRLQSLAIEFGTTGHRWGVTHSIAEVPLFVDSGATRIIQYADLVSYALWRKFEKNDGEFFAVIENAFDSEGGVTHGLVHKKQPGELCDCPYCQTRGRLL